MAGFQTTTDVATIGLLIQDLQSLQASASNSMVLRSTQASAPVSPTQLVRHLLFFSMLIFISCWSFFTGKSDWQESLQLPFFICPAAARPSDRKGHGQVCHGSWHFRTETYSSTLRQLRGHIADRELAPELRKQDQGHRRHSLVGEPIGLSSKKKHKEQAGAVVNHGAVVKES